MTLGVPSPGKSSLCGALHFSSSLRSGGPGLLKSIQLRKFVAVDKCAAAKIGDLEKGREFSKS